MPNHSATRSPLSGASNPDLKQWFVLRDLKRANAKRFSWQDIRDSGFEVFTPMHQVILLQGGKRIRKDVPVIKDLLFVHASKDELDPIIEKTPTLQYRFLKKQYMKPMTVRDEDMRRFLRITAEGGKIRYFTPEELSPSMIGKSARVVGGPLNGYEGKVLSVRGSKVKRLLVELPGLISAGIEVSPEFIEIIDQ